ncbi:S-adenosylmethionine:tRNA ribosyltransferase-isomerase [Rugosimonospora africana]|uniref:S-adenosylmethionine:tRNA ribosyltransferase-isomerase n=1 Tax=Rugosimonospora africana TaxID=556532 RepID=A0A8J3VN36_9ACTN|nr:S-adenosylmethionine:tRNA ribosyltransferase-isomerase [Rugosimonospora africana]GIH12550.1 S-adenosylmethionine:tRNA ribosyltransferase-isomerase [Rugosimonospora africana]
MSPAAASPTHTAASPAPVVDFTLPANLEAHEPPEARGLSRDGVRLLVGDRATGEVSHHGFTELPGLLRAGDVLVVNTSGTLPAAVPVPDSPLTVHFSTQAPDGRWLVELRTAAGTAPYPGGCPEHRYRLPGGATLTLREEYSRGRLWYADVDTAVSDVEERDIAVKRPLSTGIDAVPGLLRRYGAPIRYGYVPRPWPLPYYQTVFATTPGSAEMPSAARPFSERLVTRLVSAGIQVAPILLHTGVASPEAHERPYPERFAVPGTTARIVNQARAAGGRIVAVGTTAVRALESAATATGTVAAASGWTDLVITPDRGVRAVDGLLTGLHEPRASHLDMLAAIAGTELLSRCYQEAIAAGYLWHEFGDVNLLL